MRPSLGVFKQTVIAWDLRCLTALSTWPSAKELPAEASIRMFGGGGAETESLLSPA